MLSGVATPLVITYKVKAGAPYFGNVCHGGYEENHELLKMQSCGAGGSFCIIAMKLYLR